YRRRGRARPGRFEQPIRDRLQYAVADSGAVEIVDALEIVDVEQKDRYAVSPPFRRRQRATQAGEKPVAAGSPGQPIENALGARFGDDVVQRCNDADNAAVIAN